MTYSVWMEGFNVTGNASGATYIGSASGASFEEACRNLLYDGHELSDTYSPVRNTVWGCRLFDNEASARATFG